MDVYDQQIYAVGKGPSVLTVSPPNTVSVAGSKTLITGTVMDISPGTTQDNVKFRFSNGVPAVSDESQSDWMLHVYKQFETPLDVKGVKVSLYAWDGTSADSEYIDTVETDVYGQYALEWTPSKEGTWEIYAFFDGTASYYSSEAKTTAYISAAAPIIDTEPQTNYTWHFVAVILTVIIVGIAIILLTRKK
jgi:hypothetical protein